MFDRKASRPCRSVSDGCKVPLSTVDIYRAAAASGPRIVPVVEMARYRANPSMVESVFAVRSINCPVER